MGVLSSLSLLQLVVVVVLLLLAAITGAGSYRVSRDSSGLKRRIELPPKEWSVIDLAAAKMQSEQSDWISNLLLNFSAGMLGSAVTFLLISYFLEQRQRAHYDQRSAESEEKRLIRQMASSDNALALQALNELRVNGALLGGRLVGAHLVRANLAEADLTGAVLRGVVMIEANLRGAAVGGADFSDANLKGVTLDGAIAMSTVFRNANCYGASFVQTELSWSDFENTQFLSESQLQEASMLWGATMPDGSRYDGRFDLRGDREEAVRWAVHYSDPAARAAFYNAPPAGIK